MDPDEMRRRASQYRDIAKRIADERTIKALNDLAAEYETRAESEQAPRGQKVENERKE